MNSHKNAVVALRIGKSACSFLLLWAATLCVAPAQTFTVLASLNGTNGNEPYLGSVVQGFDGNFYGTTLFGGTHNNSMCDDLGCGVVFSMTPGGTVTVIYNFCAHTNCTDGAAPEAGLVQATDGNLYGTTTAGGAHGKGTIFRISPAGKMRVLYSFCAQTNCADGENARGTLVQGSNGSFYGTTYGGGSSLNGTVFKVTSHGVLSTLYSFTGGADGASPDTGLVQATDGNLYGTTSVFGGGNGGTVFKITLLGALTTLYSFCVQASCPDGANPEAALIQGNDGNLYGTTWIGGASGADGGGTIFKITRSGALTTLYSLGSSDGARSTAALVQATDGNFYGTTSTGPSGAGTIFEITPSKVFTTLYTFCSQSNCADGQTPYAGLMQATDGSLYGTNLGSLASYGIIYSLDLGLGPFVEALPASGKVGASVTILGNQLSGATSVTFNGTAASFTVVSDTEITTTVPTGATSGTVEVTTPSGTLASNGRFRVKP